MCRVKFYLLPSVCYRNITVDGLLIFENNLTAIKKKDLFFVPHEFYDQKDNQDVTALEYLYDQEQSDASAYLLDRKSVV